MNEEQLTSIGNANQTDPADIPHFPIPFADHSLELPAEYDRLRQQCPVARVHMPHGGDAFLVTSYEAVAKTFNEPKCALIQFSDGAVSRLEAGDVTGTNQSGSALFSVTDARHNKLRRVVNSAFTVQAANNLRPRVIEVTHALVDAMVHSGAPADLFEDYAIQVPMTVICEMLGVPRQEEHLYRASARTIISTTATPDERQDQLMKMVQYLGPVIEQARTNPRENVLGMLIRANEQGDDVMNVEEMYSFAIGLIAAGFETVSTTFTNSAFIILQRPDLVAQLRAIIGNPEQLATAVEEILRVTPIGPGRPRITREPIQIGETEIPTGEVVFLSANAANFDSSVFPDAREIRLDRDLKPILSFGRGIHACMGQQIARMELQILWTTLLSRLPTIRLAVAPSEVPWRADDTLTFGPANLPVIW